MRTAPEIPLRQSTPKRGIREWLGACSWLGCVQFFVCEALATLGWRGHYSYRSNFISDLGARSCGHICSHWHALMNASFFLQGVLIAGGALLLPRELSSGWLGRCARVLLLLAALGMLAISLAPEDVDQNLHIAGARLHFLCGTLAMLSWGLAGFLNRQSRLQLPLQAPAIALAAFAIAFLGDFLLVYGNSQTAAVLGTGTVERIAAYPFPLWLTWTGLMLVRSMTPSDMRLIGDRTPGGRIGQRRDL